MEVRRIRPSRSTASQYVPAPPSKSVTDRLKTMSSVLRRSKSGAENINPNFSADRSVLASVKEKESEKLPLSSEARSRSDGKVDKLEVPSDSHVKVVARIRPVNGHEKDEDVIVRKVSSGSLSMEDKTFNFDAVVDSNGTQEEMFQLVGVPVVRDCLAGFNTSILSYGQMGGGKTYTMWGPPSAMVEGCSSNSKQGLVPRIFNMIFAEIEKKQNGTEEKLTSYHCRCSFLEIYDEKIADLLDPTLRNLQIRDDAKTGFYVENLTEEYVSDPDDVTLLLIKGLSNRKVGATSTNCKSSRSHIIFTCLIESWSKGVSAKNVSSSKSSRISFIDLAGSVRNKPDDAGREWVKESRNINKSLARLGNLVNVLAQADHSEKTPNIPYRGSSLTNLLRESLGGNAKLTLLCAISPSGRCRSETLSTLRFGQRAKCIQNKAVINEITEDDVNDLGDQIRQLKEELIKAKSNGINPIIGQSGYLKSHHARESLNQLRVSLNRSIALTHVENNDSEEEENFDEEDLNNLRIELESLQEDNLKDVSESKVVEQSSSSDGSLGLGNCLGSSDEKTLDKELGECPVSDDGKLDKLDLPAGIAHGSFFLQEPALCESPKIKDKQNSAVTSSTKMSAGVLRQSVKRSDHVCLSLRSSHLFPNPTESLAASLQRGLQIIDQHQRNSSSKKDVDSFSFGEFVSRCPDIDKTDAGVQTLEVEEMGLSLDKTGDAFLCTSCKQTTSADDCKQVEGSLNMWIVPARKAEASKNAGKDLEEALKKQVELEALCSEQATKIEQLNSMVEQYRHRQPHNLTIDQGPETKALSLDHLENENVEHVSMTIQNKAFSDLKEREELLEEVETLRRQLQAYTDASQTDPAQIRKSIALGTDKSVAEFDKERERWTEMESRWICLTEELRVDLESNRQIAEKMQSELRSEKKCAEELDDALQRSILGHARIIEHYTELQEKYNDLMWKHRKIMEGIAEVKKTAAKIGPRGARSCFVESLAAELSALRVEREREKEILKKENKGLRIQLRDTAEAVHAAGELLVRLREAEETASIAEENCERAKQEIERLKKQHEKVKRKHAMEMTTMKHYLAESRLPESAIRPIFQEDSDKAESRTYEYVDDQDWRSEFGPSYRGY